MSAEACEIVLAVLYSCKESLDFFLLNPEEFLTKYDLSEQERIDLLAMDRDDLQLVARSIARKRELHQH